MLTYSFADLGSDSLYEHLYKCMKNDIVKGLLPAGMKLPSKRSFSKNLGISVITVENAYAQLIAEGYVYSIPKKGFFVVDLSSIVPEHSAALSNETVEMSAGDNSYFVDFTNNQTSISNFPFSIWAKLIRELLNENQQELVTNPPCGGVYALREAIAGHLKAFRGMNVSPEQVIVGAGTEYLYGLLIQLLGFDKTYAVEEPGYDKISHIYESHHATCRYIPMDHAGIQVTALESSHVDVIHISPSHHFPTGIIMPVSRRYELLGWASKSDSRYIIEDEYDSEFRMIGQLIPTIQNIDVLEKVIYVNTFSKTLASTVRISYMVLPMHLINRFYERLSFYSCTVSNFEQYTLARFIKEGYFEKHLNRMRSFYHAKRDKLLQLIKKSPLSDCTEIMEEDSGLHFLIRFHTELTDSEFCKRAEQNGIKIRPLSYYYKDSKDAKAHVFLINYSAVPEEKMEEALKRIIKLLK